MCWMLTGRLARFGVAGMRSPHGGPGRTDLHGVRDAARGGPVGRGGTRAAAGPDRSGAGRVRRTGARGTAVNPVVLIVDDSLTVRMDLARAFEVAGFRPVPVASVAAAR